MEKKITINESIKILHTRQVIKPKVFREFPLAEDKKEAKKVFIEIAKSIDKTIKDFNWLPEYEKIIEWMVNPNKKGLLLSGDPGRLKTITTTLIFPVLWHQLYGFIVKPVEASEIELNMQLFKNSPIINIDDVGTEPTINDFGSKYEPFSRLVDFCEKNSKILIITTNYSRKEMWTRYGTRTVDRLDLLCEPIPFKGDSFRWENK